jgi:GxxExxY protein
VLFEKQAEENRDGDSMLQEEELSEAVLGASMDVHRDLGPGLLESAYQVCVAQEFKLRGIKYRREVDLPVRYKGILLDCGYRMDFVVEEKLILECKAVEKLAPIHEAQLITYLKLSGYRIGLLINFNSAVIRNSFIRRVV